MTPPTAALRSSDRAEREALALVLNRIGLAILATEAAAAAAEVCPPFRAARAYMLKMGPDARRPSVAPAMRRSNTTPAMLATAVVATAPGFAPLAYVVEGLATGSAPFTSEERAELVARGWLLDLDAAGVAEALARVQLEALVEADRAVIAQPRRPEQRGPEFLLQIEAMAALRRREVVEPPPSRRTAFLGEAVARCEAIAAMGPRPQRTNRRGYTIAVGFLRRFSADPEVAAAAVAPRRRAQLEALDALHRREVANAEAHARRTARLVARADRKAQRDALRAEALANRAKLRAARGVVVSP